MGRSNWLEILLIYETKQLHFLKLGSNGALSPGVDARVLDWAEPSLNQLIP